MTKRRFSHHGLLALSPAAIDAEFDRAKPKTELAPDLATVTIRGPLFGYADSESHFDSYERIRASVGLALASSAPTVVLLIDSPGGLAAGCLELSRDLRAAAQRAGKELIAYVDGQACSAAYALACACSRIIVGESASVGSVGIIDALLDQTALNRANGLRIELIASGERKTFGNPNTPMTDEAIEASRARVEQLAGNFFDLVGKARGVSPSKVRALEAGVFMGAEAVRVGLADQVCTFGELLALVGGKASPKASTAAKPASVSPAHPSAMAMAGAPGMTGAVRSTPPVPVAHRTPASAEPTKPIAEKDPIMSTSQFQAIEAEQRAAYFDKHPSIPAYLMAALSGESMRKVRSVCEAYLGVGETAQSIESKLLACMNDQSATNGDQRRAQRALEAIGRNNLQPTTRQRLEQKADLDMRMNIDEITYSGCVISDHRVVLGAPVPKAEFGRIKDERSSQPSRLPPDQKAELDRRMGLTRQDGGIYINEPHRVVLGALR